MMSMSMKDVCLHRSYMYRRIGDPKTSYLLRRMASRAERRGW